MLTETIVKQIVDIKYRVARITASINEEVIEPIHKKSLFRYPHF